MTTVTLPKRMLIGHVDSNGNLNPVIKTGARCLYRHTCLDFGLEIMGDWKRGTLQGYCPFTGAWTLKADGYEEDFSNKMIFDGKDIRFFRKLKK